MWVLIFIVGVIVGFLLSVILSKVVSVGEIQLDKDYQALIIFNDDKSVEKLKRTRLAIFKVRRKN